MCLFLPWLRCAHFRLRCQGIARVEVSVFIGESQGFCGTVLWNDGQRVHSHIGRTCFCMLCWHLSAAVIGFDSHCLRHRCCFLFEARIKTVPCEQPVTFSSQRVWSISGQLCVWWSSLVAGPHRGKTPASFRFVVSHSEVLCLIYYAV